MTSVQKNRHRSKSIVSDIATTLPEAKSNLKLDVHSSISNKSESGISKQKLDLLKSSVDDLLIKRPKIQTEPFSVLDPLHPKEFDNVRNGYLNSFGYDVLLSPESFNSAFNHSVAKYLKFQNEIISKYNMNDATLNKIDYLQKCIDELTNKYETIKNDTKEFQAQSDQLISEYEELTEFHDQLSSDLQHFDNLAEINAFLNKPGLNKIVKSSRFNLILKNLDNSLKFINDNPDFLDADSYKGMLHSSLSKALTLVKTYVINNLNTTYNMISNNISQIKESNSVITDAFIYNKFEINSQEINKYMLILYDKKHIYGNEYDGLLSDIFASYFQIRMKLILPIMNSNLNASSVLNNEILQVFEDNLNFYIDLINNEYEVFYKFFNEFRLVEEIESARLSNIEIKNIRSPTMSTFSLGTSIKQGSSLSVNQQNSYRNISQFGEEPDYTDNPEFNYFNFLNYGSGPFLAWISEQVMESIYDFLRNKILKEQDIKVLCQLIIMLQKYYPNSGDDIDFNDKNQEFNKFHINFGKLFNPILTDLQTRLIFKVQVFIDDSIMKYKPKLDDFKITSSEESYGDRNTDNVDESIVENEKYYADWYPTLKESIVLLTQIDQLVNNAIFDDLAHHVIHLCIVSLREAYQFSLKTSGAKDSSLFLIKNLLILKKNVENLDIEYTNYNDVDIDFSGLKEIFNNVKTGKVFKNGLISLARDTIPKLVTNMGDAKLELQIELRNTVHSFIESIVQKVNSVLQEPIKTDTNLEVLTEKYKESLRAEFKSLGNVLPLYIHDTVVIDYLIDGIKELLIQNYELLYNKIVDCVESDPSADKEKLNDLMELDVLINYLNQLSNEYRIIEEPHFDSLDNIEENIGEQQIDNNSLTLRD